MDFGDFSSHNAEILGLMSYAYPTVQWVTYKSASDNSASRDFLSKFWAKFRQKIAKYGWKSTKARIFGEILPIFAKFRQKIAKYG